MGSGRKFALVLLCAMVTGAGWCAARLGGFEWSGIENSATAIWDRVAARAARISSTDVGPVAIASVTRATTSRRELPEPADRGPRATGFGLASVSTADAWGTRFATYIDQPWGAKLAAEKYVIISGGKDGVIDTEQGQGAITNFDCDIVYGSGRFLSYPDGLNLK